MGEVRPQSETMRAGLIPHRWTRVEDPGSVAVVESYETIIAGGGPAGLTAAYELTKHGQSCVVLEADPRMVGGISRTDQYKGYRFDIGGHRFFSKSAEVNALWREILGRRAASPATASAGSTTTASSSTIRSSRSTPSGSWASSGPAASSASYLKAQVRPIRPERTYRGLGRQSLRPRAVRDLLQVLHREGLGNADQHDLSRLGGAADQGPEPDPRRDLGPVRRLRARGAARSSRRSSIDSSTRGSVRARCGKSRGIGCARRAARSTSTAAWSGSSTTDRP